MNVKSILLTGLVLIGFGCSSTSNKVLLPDPINGATETGSYMRPHVNNPKHPAWYWGLNNWTISEESSVCAYNAYTYEYRCNYVNRCVDMCTVNVMSVNEKCELHSDDTKFIMCNLCGVKHWGCQEVTIPLALKASD
jgi:ferredoxin